ncbi:MAG: transcription-repair coupling factor, partial [Eubacterium sp.]|nr:transcription-repair coupling factor [Eubacterium sp.]
IIETGMDIANVNTLIVCDADRLGLSQLYQLRGRVGRSNRNAYAFLMYRRNKMLKEDAEKRLHAIREFTELGSGVKIAMRDLEIRGAGNLLGAQQSGHMEAVGYDLYCKMLNEAVQEAKGRPQVAEFETTIDIAVDAFIPETYIPEEGQKLDIYKRIAGIENEDEADDMIGELIDRFGEPPRSVTNLVGVSLLKAAAHQAYISEIKQMGREIQIMLYPQAAIQAVKIPEVLDEERFRGRFIFRAGAKPHFSRTLRKASDRNADRILQILTEFAKALQEIRTD